MGGRKGRVVCRQHTSGDLRTIPVSTFGHVVVSASPWCIFPYNLMQDIFIQSKVRHFSEIQDGGRRHLGFSVYVNLAIPALLIVCYLCSVTNLVQISVIEHFAS